MIEWIQTWPDWLQSFWFVYITFHDFVQWGIIALVGLTAWGQRREKKRLEALVEHIHEELHAHIKEDASLHELLGQSGMTKGV